MSHYSLTRCSCLQAFQMCVAYKSLDVATDMFLFLSVTTTQGLFYYLVQNYYGDHSNLEIDTWQFSMAQLISVSLCYLFMKTSCSHPSARLTRLLHRLLYRPSLRIEYMAVRPYTIYLICSSDWAFFQSAETSISDYVWYVSEYFQRASPNNDKYCDYQR